MTRIVAGEARGRRLRVPAGAGTRPTSDRVREALFSALESALGSWSGVRVLDLYAGSGALGLEALSRGAAAAELVEVARSAVVALRHNVEQLALPGARVVSAKVERHVEGFPDEPFDVALLDPPYPLPNAAVTDVLSRLVRRGWLAEEAVVVVERATRAGALGWPPGLEAVRERRYGETTLWYGRCPGESEAAPANAGTADEGAT